MLQAYPGSDPIRDVTTGRISLRRFRLMVENLPPGNPLYRARFGDWADSEALLYAVESRLRDLITLTGNINRRAGSPAREPEYLPRPLTPEEQRQEALQRTYDDLMQQQLEQL